MWTVDDTDGELQSTLQRLGCDVTYRASLGRQTSGGDSFPSLLQRHAEERPDLVWINLFCAGTHHGSNSDKKAAIRLIRLMREQMGIQRHVVCTGHRRLNTWSLLALREAPQIPGFHHSAIQMCNFFAGLSSQFAVLSSFPLDPAWSTCGCTRSTHDVPHTTTQQAATMSAFAQKILELLVGIRPEFPTQFRQTPSPPPLTTVAPVPPVSPLPGSTLGHGGGIDDEQPDDLRTGQPTVAARFVEEAFPTEESKRQKEKEKERKKRGETAKKKKQIVEQVFEDCGADFSPLFADVPNDSEVPEWEFDSTPATDSFLEAFDSLSWDRGFTGSSVCPNLDDDQGVRHYCDVYALCADIHENVDAGAETYYQEVAEICGGEGTTGRLLVRRRVAGSTRNFDLTTDIDLTTEAGRRALLYYIRHTKPIMVIMAPPCTGLFGFAALNRVIHYETWAHNVQIGKQLATLCGQVALEQLRGRRHYVIEQPAGSALFQLAIWQRIANTAFWTRFDQCRFNLRGPRTGMLIRKRTELWSSAWAIIAEFAGKYCDGTHEHAVLGGRRGDPNFELTRSAQVWPMPFCAALARGCAIVMRDAQTTSRSASLSSAFPTVGTDAPPPAPSTAAARESGCPACRAHRSAEDPRHTRVLGECLRAAAVAPANEFTCPACVQGLPAQDSRHTWDPTCRLPQVVRREGGPRPPVGRHNRDPRIPAAHEPSAALPPGPPAADSAEELAADAVPAVPAPAPAELPARGPEYGGGASSSDPLPRGQRPPRAPRAPAARAAAAAAAPRPAGPQRRDAGVQAAADDVDWQSFDIGRALRTLNAPDQSVVRRTPSTSPCQAVARACTSPQELLRNAGIPASTLALIPDCRLWARPGRRAITESLRLAYQMGGRSVSGTSCFTRST